MNVRHHDHEHDHAPILGVKVGTKCNFCDNTTGLELHHIIPRSHGGSDESNNLITVCNVHHAILHGMKSRGNISELTKKGLASAKSRGVKLGNPNAKSRVTKEGTVVLGLADASKLGQASNAAKADEFAKHIQPTIQRLLNEGMSIRAIARELNASGIKTARGGEWHGRTVTNIVERFVSQK